MGDEEKVIFIGDQHIEARNGSDAWRKFFKEYLLVYVLGYCKDNKIKHVISMGDFLDIRRSLLGEDMYWLVTEFIPLVAEYGITYHIIQGNHSQIRKDSNLLTWDDWIARESLPYGSCVKAYTTPQDLVLGDTTFAILPWVNNSSHDITVEYINNTEATVALGHLELANFSMGGSLCKHGTLDTALLSKFENTYSGHFHNESESGCIKYLGTPYDLTWQDHLDCTVKGIYTFGLLTNELTFIPNPEGMSMFTVLEYNYTNIASAKEGKKWHDTSFLEDNLNLLNKVIHINVTDRSDAPHFTKFIKTLRSVVCIDYTVIDTTQETIIDFEEVSAKDFKVSPIEILLNKVNDIAYYEDDESKEIRYESICKKLKSVYDICQNENNLI